MQGNWVFFFVPFFHCGKCEAVSYTGIIVFGKDAWRTVSHEEGKCFHPCKVILLPKHGLSGKPFKSGKPFNGFMKRAAHFISPLVLPSVSLSNVFWPHWGNKQVLLEGGGIEMTNCTGTDDIRHSIDLKLKIAAIMTNVITKFLCSCFLSYL